MRLNYLDRAYIVTMSVDQYSLLLNFETQNGSTVSELASRQGVSIPTVIKALKGLIDGSVLSCTDQVSFEKFMVSLKLTGLRIPLVAKN